jgi:hypothetical protein
MKKQKFFAAEGAIFFVNPHNQKFRAYYLGLRGGCFKAPKAPPSITPVIKAKITARSVESNHKAALKCYSSS